VHFEDLEMQRVTLTRLEFLKSKEIVSCTVGEMPIFASSRFKVALGRFGSKAVHLEDDSDGGRGKGVTPREGSGVIGVLMVDIPWNLLLRPFESLKACVVC
jgi:hypothetical protein